MFKNIGEKVIVGVISAVALGAIYAAWEAIKNSSVDIVIPTDAVVAFDATECPDGWRPVRELEQRFVLGANAEYAVGSEGGSETHVLKVSELPAHGHTGRTRDTSGTANTAIAAVGGSGYRASSFSVDERPEVGAALHPMPTHSHNVVIDGSPGLEAAPHENMPPFLALLYCIKS